MTPNPLAGPAVSTVEQALSRMEAMQEFIVSTAKHGSDDGVACFNFLYHAVTSRVLDALNRGIFRDSDFMSTLDVCFANRYFAAMGHIPDAIARMPDSWRALVRRRDDRDVAGILFAAGGVNAHVNFDLPASLIECCSKLDVEFDAMGQREDYLRVNQIFVAEMAELRQHFLDKTRGLDEKYLAPVLNSFGNFSVVAARDAAWMNASVLWQVRKVAFVQKLYLDRIDNLVGLAGNLIMTRVPGLADAL